MKVEEAEAEEVGEEGYSAMEREARREQEFDGRLGQ